MVKNEFNENIYVDTKMQRRTRKLNHAIKDNSLSIVLFAPFLIYISAESFAGWRLQNETFVAHGQASIGCTDIFCLLALSWKASPLIGRPPSCSLAR